MTKDCDIQSLASASNVLADRVDLAMLMSNRDLLSNVPIVQTVADKNLTLNAERDSKSHERVVDFIAVDMHRISAFESYKSARSRVAVSISAEIVGQVYMFHVCVCVCVCVCYSNE